MPKTNNQKFPNVSIIVPTYNSPETAVKTIKGILSVNYPGKFETIVINDGSTDNTKEFLQKNFASNSKVKLINFSKNQGVCKARNAGILEAKFEIIINMDHDCVPDKNWLKDMIKEFNSPNVGIITAYPPYGGTSTGFRKEALQKVGGGYDEDYFYYREDSDLTFKIMEAGYELRVSKAKYYHTHEEVKPKGLLSILKYGWKRAMYHQNDVLLYKKHPNNNLVKEFLDIKFGFLLNPMHDFRIITGTWEKGKKLNISSPRGITFIQNKTPFHTVMIFFIALGYVIFMKLVRLWASIKFRKLLI